MTKPNLGENSMKDRGVVLWLVSASVVMLGLPALAIASRSDAGMALVFLLFFAVDPFFSVLVGIFAGKNAGKRWGLPVISALLFLLGSWIFFHFGEITFVFYGVIYLILGVVSMGITGFLQRKRRE